MLGAFAILPAVAQVPKTDPNWSGYVVTGATNSVKAASGSWIVPAVTCNGQDVSQARFWVGIDGYPGSTVEQIGISAVCVTGQTTPLYSAWYEFFPSLLKDINLAIAANDKISATVLFNGGTQFTLTLTDERTGSSGPIIGNPPAGFTAERTSAECIVEMPPGTTPLADFGKVLFGKDKTGVPKTCYATVAGQTAPIGNFPPTNPLYKLTLVNKYSKAVPSPLSTDKSSFSITSCTAPPSGMVGWWPGDGNANDIIGGNNGTFTANTYAPGEVGQAFSLDGLTGYVDIPQSLNIPGPSPITVDAWVNPSDVTTYHEIFSQLSTSYNQGEVDLRINGPGGNLNYTPGTFGWFRRSSQGSTTVDVTTTSTLAVAGHWQHVAAVFDGSNYQIYVNGVLQSGALNFDDAIGIVPGPDNTIGEFPGGEDLFAGLIDEVDVFNRALSATEIQAIYNAGHAGKCK